MYSFSLKLNKQTNVKGGIYVYTYPHAYLTTSVYATNTSPLPLTIYAGQTVKDVPSFFVYGLGFFSRLIDGPKSKDAPYSPRAAGNETLLGDCSISGGALLSFITWNGILGSWIL